MYMLAPPPHPSMPSDSDEEIFDYASNNACRHIHSKCMRTKFDAREYLNRTRAQQKYQRNFIGCARTHESAGNMLKLIDWVKKCKLLCWYFFDSKQRRNESSFTWRHYDFFWRDILKLSFGTLDLENGRLPMDRIFLNDFQTIIFCSHFVF